MFVMEENRHYRIRRHEYAHGQSANTTPGRTESYGPEAFRGFSNPASTGRDYESNAGYRENYNRLGEASGEGENADDARHKGKGPRTYTRSDDRILEDINDRMCDNPYLDASEIEVTVNNGEVILTGTVENKEAKWLAEDIGEEISGVKNVENRLKVKVRGI
jgi:osmotically-inducible protein OsmY